MTLARNDRNIIGIYLLYSILFLLIHLGFVSTVSFFHFLLDHDMTTIERWVHRNSWDILVCSKFLSWLLFFFVLKLNLPEKNKLNELLKSHFMAPTLTNFLFSLLILVGVSFLIKESVLRIEQDQGIGPTNTSRFFGALGYFALDSFLVFILMNSWPKRDISPLAFDFILAGIFCMTSWIAIPFLGWLTLLVGMHFFVLLKILNSKNLSDILVYCVLTIAAANSLMGVDLVGGVHIDIKWPLFFGLGLLLIIIFGFSYRKISRLNEEN